MPVNDNYEIQEYYGNSSGRIFNFPFRCFSLEHLVVELLGADGSVTTLLQNTDYAVSGGLDNAGGMVTYPLASELPPLCPSERLRIYRVTPLEQPIDYPSYQQTIENALDKTTMLLQEAVNESAVALARAAEEKVDSVISATLTKADLDGANIDKFAFLDNLGIGSDGEVNLTDLTCTDASNADPEAFRVLVGMPEAENITADNVLRLESLESELQEVAELSKCKSAIRAQTIVAGATGTIPEGWEEGWCDAPAAHIYSSGTNELTIVSGLQVAAGYEGQVYVSQALAEDIVLDVSDCTTSSESVGHVYALIGTDGSISAGITTAAPQVGLSPSYDISLITPVMTANSSGDFTAAGSSVASTTYYNYYEAFNRVVAVQYDGWLSANNFVFNADSIYDGDEYIRISRTDLEALTANKVRLCPYSEGGTIYGKAYKFNLEAVDADENITILKTVDNCNDWAAGEYLEFEFDTTSTVYLQIRVLQTYGYVSCGFSDIQWVYDESMLTESSEAMTSATAPSGNAVTADSYYNETWAPYHAMDGVANDTTGAAWESDASTGEHWLMREFPEARALQSYSVYIWNGFGGYQYAMSTWTLYGSDGTTFTELDSQTIDAQATAGTTLTFDVADTDTPYKFFKITGQSDAGTYCIIGELILNFKVSAGDFYSTAKQTHFDQYGNSIRKVYLGKAIFSKGAIESVVNYQQGTVHTSAVKNGKAVGLATVINQPSAFLGNCSIQLRMRQSDLSMWGDPFWSENYGQGARAYSTGGVVRLITGTNSLDTYRSTVQGSEFGTTANQTSVTSTIFKVTETRAF